MKIHTFPLETLTPYDRNPRKNEAAIDKVARSIEAFGFKQPIVVDKDQVIIVGHTRYLAAKQLGLEKVPVLVAEDLSPEQAKAYRLADNRTHEESHWDNDLLALELGDLSRCDFDLSLTGFNADELRGFTALTESVVEGLIDEAAVGELPEAPVAKLGDIWQLGRHLVMCGDSTCFAHVDGLMAGVQADLVFTDPPYNVRYHAKLAHKRNMQGDDYSNREFMGFLQQVFAHCAKVIKPTASLYVCHGFFPQRAFQQALEANGFCIRNQLIWAKHHFVQNFGRYKLQHELMFYAHVKQATDHWYGDNGQTTLWSFKKPYANRLHPTMKPVDLIEKALHNSSQPGDIVLDLFGGSGSTLIGCEKTDRVARLMEIDPKYVDVIIARWQDFTGQTAILINSVDAASKEVS